MAYLNNADLIHPAPNGAVDGKVLSRHMIIQGIIRVDGNPNTGEDATTRPVTALLDTGALLRSFIAAVLVDSDPVLTSMVRYEKTKVILGDGNEKQAIECNGVITLNVDFRDDKGNVYSAKKMKCVIMPTLSVNMIVGLTDIVKQIPKLFIRCLVAAINDAHKGETIDAMCEICSGSKPLKEAEVPRPGLIITETAKPVDTVPIILNALTVMPEQIQTVSIVKAQARPRINDLDFSEEKKSIGVSQPNGDPALAMQTALVAHDGNPTPPAILKDTTDQVINVITVITLNVNGLKNVTQSGALQAYMLKQPRLEQTIFALQETKIAQTQEPSYTKLFLDLGCIQTSFHSNANRGGVAFISWLPEHFVELTGMARRDDDGEARINIAVFRQFSINNVYKPYRNKGRSEYCIRFGSDYNMNVSDQLNINRRHIIIAGDVNVAPTRLDETSNADQNGPCSTPEERELHANLLKLGVRDAWREKHKDDIEFTTSSNVAEWKITKTNSKAEIVEKRLDVILVSSKVKVISAGIDHSTRSFTDHSAVIATLDVSQHPTHIPGWSKAKNLRSRLNSIKTRNEYHKKFRTRLNSIAEEGSSSVDSDTLIEAPRPCFADERVIPPDDDDDKHPWGLIEHDGESIPAAAPWWRQRAETARQRRVNESLLRDIKNTIQYNEVNAFLHAMEETDIPSLQQTIVERLMTMPVIEEMVANLCDGINFFESGEGEGGTAETQTPLNTTSVDMDKIMEELKRGDIQPPWEKPRKTAPEDAHIDPPGLFGEYWERLQHMSLSESNKEFLSQIPSHVQESLLSDPKWMDMLTTKGLIVWGEKVTTGITGVEPLEIHVSDDMPPEHRAKLRPPAQQIRQEVRDYIASLIGTMFERSDSSITSPMTVAPKSTTPFFRLAGDYRWLNQFVLMVQSYVPIIMDELYRAKGWKYFADIDWRAAFHQIPLTKRTSKLMTLMTVLGPLRPKFMMEGVNLASNVLQNVVAEIFDPLREDGIFMFDNVLMGAETPDELFDKVNKFLDICIERNIKMNFSKTWIGFNKATFFGYVLDEHGYRLDESRKKAIAEIPMPGWGKTKKENATQMRSFLGFSVYFIPFVENYAKMAAPLHDMTHMDFDWTESTWTRNYKSDFENFKSTLSSAMDLVFPDFDLEWIFLPDASEFACGWIILQLRPMPDGSLRPEPISIGSEKFSETAVDWPINEKEAYAMVRGMKVNQGILRGKPFLVATDHWNLTFIEKDPNSKMQRYMMEMQLMPIKGCLRISGKDNPADYPSRWHKPPETLDPPSTTEPLQSLSEREYYNALRAGKFAAPVDTVKLHYISQAETVFLQQLSDQQTDADDDVEADIEPNESGNVPFKHRPKKIKHSPEAKLKMFKACHGGTAGCWGIRRTYRDIMQLYPGNDMSYQEIYDMVQLCPDCQKRRVTLPGDRKTPRERVIGPFGPHECVSIDGAPISISGPDENGYNGFNLVKNMGMGYICIIPYKNKTIDEAVDALLLARLRIGHFSILLSDPGSDYTGKLMKSFNNLIDVRHRLTHVGRPQASGIEPDIKEAKRFLTALAESQGLRHNWGSPRVCAIAEFLINSDPDEDSGISPYEMMHGRRDHRVFNIFKKQTANLPSDFDKHAYLKTLVEEFKTIQSIFLKCKRERADRITRRNLVQPQNMFQPGDLAFYIIDKRDKDNSFQSTKMGPYEVLKQTNNDVTYKSLVTGAIKTCDVSDMALFSGSREDAYRLALTDQNQVVITSIDAWRGNPDTRTSTKFLTTFEDGSQLWQSYQSVKDTTQFEQLCNSDPRLRELTDTTQVRNARIKEFRVKPVPVKIGATIYVDLRWISHTLYQFKQLKLTDKYSRRWLFPAVVTAI